MSGITLVNRLKAQLFPPVAPAGTCQSEGVEPDRGAFSTLASDADALELRRRWREANLEYEGNGGWGPSDGSPFRLNPGTAPKSLRTVLITAVHGVRHRRAGATKANDANTAGLAVVLAERLGASLAVIRRDEESEDANRASDHPFNRAVERAGLLVPHMLVADLHGMADRSDDIDVALGWACHSPSGAAAQILAAHLESVGYRIDGDGSRTGLGATRDGTVTRWAQRGGATAVQVEISRALRTFAAGSDPLRSGHFAAALASGIAAAAAQLGDPHPDGNNVEAVCHLPE